MNFQMFKLDLEKTEKPEIKLPTSVGSQKKQESFRKASALLNSLVAQMVKASAYNTEDQGSIPESGRSPGEGNCNPFQYQRRAMPKNVQTTVQLHSFHMLAR